MAFSNAAWEALEQAAGMLCDVLNDGMEILQEAMGEKVDDPMYLTAYSDPRFQAMRRERRECLQTYGPNFTADYEENGYADESPEEFLQRREEEYEYYQEWLDSDDSDEVSLEEYEEWKKTEDYGMTDDESDSDDW